jgi:hypothetical protein
MDIKIEENELKGERVEFYSLKREERIDMKYEEGNVPAPFSVIICEDMVSSVTNVTCCSEKYLVPRERSGLV